MGGGGSSTFPVSLTEKRPFFDDFLKSNFRKKIKVRGEREELGCVVIFLQLSIPDKLFCSPILIWLLQRDHIHQRQSAGIKNRDGRLSLGFNSCDASRAQLVKTR